MESRKETAARRVQVAGGSGTTAINDIHSDREIPTGSPTAALGGELTGTWLADGRTTDPASVLNTDTPAARLHAFTGSTVQRCTVTRQSNHGLRSA